MSFQTDFVRVKNYESRESRNSEILRKIEKASSSLKSR